MPRIYHAVVQARDYFEESKIYARKIQIPDNYAKNVFSEVTFYIMIMYILL